MKTHRKRGLSTLFLIFAITLQSILLLFPDPSLGFYIPSVSATSSLDATWNPVQPFEVTDDSQSSFWTVTHSGIGSIIVNTSDESLNRKSGEDCLKIVSKNGTYKYFDIHHEYQKNRNFYPLKVFVFWWYGNKTSAKFRLHLYTPDAENKLYYDFFDEFSGWRQFVLYFDINFTKVGKTNLSLLKEIHISLETANVQGTWYLDDVIADVVSIWTPEDYLAEYEWSLNNLLDHRDETLKIVLAGWSASDGGTEVKDFTNYKDVYRFDLTLPTFTEAYKITGNITYLEAAKESFDGAINYLYNPETQLFSTGWNSTSETYVNELEILWGAVTLNGMYEFCRVSPNMIFLTYANSFARALHTYGINQTTNLPHHLISVSSGCVITSDACVPMDTARLISAYIKGYEVTSIEAFRRWAKDLTQAFWAKRNKLTNLFPLRIDSNGTVIDDYCRPNLDPIQNVLLYAYEITKDDFYLSLTVNLTDAQLTYAWYQELGRTVQSVWTNGSIRLFYLDLVDGPQLYVAGLFQLSYYTSINTYLTYAEELWNTIRNNGIVNNVYITELGWGNRPPNDRSNIYTQQMMIQCDAYLFHFTKNQTYLDDLKSTVNNFLLHYKMPYGFCFSINASNHELISDNTFDWLDSTSYLLGAAIYACSIYTTQNTTSVEADITYYGPYYPIFKTKGELNYTNNKIHFDAKGTPPCLNLTFTFPRGKVIDTITVNGSATFLFIKNAPYLIICKAGMYSITVTMKNGDSQNITVKEFDFADGCLTVTVAAATVVNVTTELKIPFNDTYPTPFPDDAWDVNCTEAQWGNNWNPVNRILTTWAICNPTTTIMIFNQPPKTVELYNPKGVTENSLILVWEKTNASDFVKYEVYMSPDGANWTLIQTITTRLHTAYRITELSPNSTYYFFIRTVDAGELSTNSRQVSCKTAPLNAYQWILPYVVIVMFILIVALVFIMKRRRKKELLM